MTYREAIYICLDLVKLAGSDDSYLTEDHVKFLLNKYRAAIIKKEYETIKKKNPQSLYQTICLDLEETNAIDGEPCTGGTYLKSVQEIPTTLNIGAPVVYPMDYYQGNITYISRERMRYVGYNKYLKNIIYASLGPDNHLYLTSNNPQHKYLEKVQFNGIFEDAEKANELSCNKEDKGKSCGPLDAVFPIEEALFPQLQAMVVQDILGAAYRGADSINNAKDDLSDIATFIRRNVKSNMQKQIEG